MKHMHMHVFFDGRLICIETNSDFAIPYWQRRRALNDRITWIIKEN